MLYYPLLIRPQSYPGFQEGISRSLCPLYTCEIWLLLTSWITLASHGSLTRYVKLHVAHAPGMPGTFSEPPRLSDPDMHHGTCVTHVPWWMSGSLTSGFLWSRWRGKRSRYSRSMGNTQFYVPGKRPMASCYHSPLSLSVNEGFTIVLFISNSIKMGPRFNTECSLHFLTHGWDFIRPELSTHTWFPLRDSIPRLLNGGRTTFSTRCAPASSQTLPVKSQGVWARGRNLEFRRWGSSGPSSLISGSTFYLCPMVLHMQHTLSLMKDLLSHRCKTEL